MSVQTLAPPVYSKASADQFCASGSPGLRGTGSNIHLCSPVLVSNACMAPLGASTLRNLEPTADPKMIVSLTITGGI